MWKLNPKQQNKTKKVIDVFEMNCDFNCWKLGQALQRLYYS